MLIVEDGSLVPNANSYASVADLTGYASLRGITLPDEGLEAMLIKATDKLETYRASYIGKRRQGAALQWPRTGVVIDGWPVSESTIPSELVKAQCVLAVTIGEGVKLYNNYDPSNPTLKRKKIDVLEWEWAVAEGDSIGLTLQPYIAEAEALLGPLISGYIDGTINSWLIRA